MAYEQQVDRNHYSFERYFPPGRWMGYYHQTEELARREDIRKVLDIGPETTFLKDVLKKHRPDMEYKTLDIATDLHADWRRSGYVYSC